jgi:hypothetical protein
MAAHQQTPVAKDGLRPFFFSCEDCLIDLDQFAILLTKSSNSENI